MGGKNAIIVMDDADLGLAVEGALWGGFWTAGQRCTAASRVVVHESVYDRFLEMFAAAARRLKVGNGLLKDTDLGPLINEQQMKRVLSYIETGKGEGAVLITGGGRCLTGDCARGFFIEPTIFAGVKPHMTISREEILGPRAATRKEEDSGACGRKE